MGHGAVKPGSRERALHAHRFTGIGDKSWAAATPISGFFRWLGHTSWGITSAGSIRRRWSPPFCSGSALAAARRTTDATGGSTPRRNHRKQRRRRRRCIADACDGRLVSGCGGGGGGSSRRPLQWNTQRHAVATYWPFRRLQQSTGEVNARGALCLPRRRRIRCLPLNNL